MFYFLCFGISLFWPGMVLNQGQLSIVVSDWESYLGSPFSLLSVWVVDLCLWHLALVSFTSFCIVSGFVGVIPK
jgi:hypothetical protein